MTRFCYLRIGPSANSVSGFATSNAAFSVEIRNMEEKAPLCTFCAQVFDATCGHELMCLCEVGGVVSESVTAFVCGVCVCACVQEFILS